VKGFLPVTPVLKALATVKNAYRMIHFIFTGSDAMDINGFVNAVVRLVNENNAYNAQQRLIPRTSFILLFFRRYIIIPKMIYGIPPLQKAILPDKAGYNLLT
jgi:hypothetical protein